MIRTAITGIGDPFILLNDGIYYMYATSAPDGFRCFTSTDLKNWSDAGYCYADSPWGENCFWAPEVYKVGDRYALLYTARWNKNHSLRTGLAFSSSPKGPFTDYDNKPLFDLGFATIDATFLFDGADKYIYFVRDCSENVVDGVHTSVIYAAKIDDTLTKFLTEPMPVSAPDEPWERTIDPNWCWNEGPAVIKRNGKYYMNFSVNCFDNRNYCVGCSVADSPLGPFVKYSDNPILRYRENDFSGPGHNCFFTDEKGDLLTAFHIHTDYDKPSGDRRACIGKVGFSEEGKMFIDLEADIYER